MDVDTRETRRKKQIMVLGKALCRSVLLAAFCCGLATAADWPQDGFDAGHGAASPEVLPAALHVRWMLDLPRLRPAWPDQSRLSFDACYHPVIVGGLAIVTSPADDSVAAYDLADGQERWRFFAGGPIRLPPASDGTRVFLGADDGWLYALGADRGNLLWKFQGAPKSRLVLGNGRLIDTWCVRGGPVVAQGKVYFAAGIWPFMGVFLHCLDATSGKPVWTNSGEGSEYLVHPHEASSFGGIAPQGTLAVAGPYLLVPGGRTLPGCYDRRTGKRQYFELATKTGDHRVVAGERYFFCAAAAYKLKSGKLQGPAPGGPVLSGGMLHGLTGDDLVAMDLDQLGRAGSKSKIGPSDFKAKTSLPGATVLIQAGNRLFAGGLGRVSAFDLPLENEEPPSWQCAVEGNVGAMAAGGGHLLVATDHGRMYCLGAGPAAAAAPGTGPTAALPGETIVQQAEALLRDSAVAEGCALLLGDRDGQLARVLAARSRLHVVVVEPDPARAQSLRVAIRGMGLYGDRIAVCVGNLASLPLPPYFASLVVADGSKIANDSAADPAWCEQLFRVLHPYHGKAYLKPARSQREALERFASGHIAGKAELGESHGWVRIARTGGLPGCGSWTHEHADAANTRVSADTLVRAPLGLLWFGGSSHEGILPRHGHGPQPQVLDGRLVIEKVDGLRSVDIYTGRVLWEASVPALGSFYNNTLHQFGANGTGTNFISTPDTLYVRYLRECLRFDPATGERLPAIGLPSEVVGPAATAETPIWGYLNVAGDYLIGGVATPDNQILPFWRSKTPPIVTAVSEKDAAEFWPSKEVPQAIESRTLFVIQRRTGKLLWSATAKGRFRHNAVCIGGGRLYAIDRAPFKTIRSMGVGESPKPPTRLVAFDLVTGRVVWSKEQAVFGTWLSYSTKRDVLVESGFFSRDTLRDEPRGMRAYRAGDGQELWYDGQLSGPPLIHGDWVLNSRGACGLLDGKPMRVDDPLTGETRPWKWNRAHGCNTPIGSEYLLTFRSGAAGYYDLMRHGGTGNWGGFRSSCSNNLIVAGGVLTAPDYTRTCTCSYQNQTSLALVPDPDVEMWTYQGFANERVEPIRRLGVNFGAPGNRVDDNGTLWLEYPKVTDLPPKITDLPRKGKSTGATPKIESPKIATEPFPKIEVTTDPAGAGFFRQHSSVMEGPMAWVCASGATGVQSVRLTLSGHLAQPRAYTVRLYFSEPEDLRPGDRPLSVAIQGQEVLSQFDIVKEAGGRRRGLMRQFSPVLVQDQLVVLLKSRGSRPTVLCGLEIIALGDRSPKSPRSDTGH